MERRGCRGASAIRTWLWRNATTVRGGGRPQEKSSRGILRLCCAAKAHPVGDFRRESVPTGNRKDAISGRKAAGRSAQNDSSENVRQVMNDIAVRMTKVITS